MWTVTLSDFFSHNFTPSVLYLKSVIIIIIATTDVITNYNINLLQYSR